MNYNLKKIFHKKRVLITGHTGFKGTWLSLWLIRYNAKILGISLINSNKNNFYSSLNLDRQIKSYYFDINKNLAKTRNLIVKFKPDFIFNLAAQALVSVSYQKPVQTLENNIGININILESLRFVNHQCSIILITSDKVYENLERRKAYTESDALGGKDIYSVSKSASELIIQGYKESFLKKKRNLKIAIARAGNVIGGGDWAKNRLVPDIFRQWKNNRMLYLRNPSSTRPWQFVLEPLYGYMILAYKIKKIPKLNYEIFNFSSRATHNLSVLKMVTKFAKLRKNKFSKFRYLKKNLFKEANILNLSSKKAKIYLKWKSFLSLNETAKLITDWYENRNKEKILEISNKQIEYFIKKINNE